MHDAKYLGGFTLALFLLLKGAYSKALILLDLHDNVAEVLKNSKGSPLLKSVVIPFDEIVSLFSGFIVFAGKANHQGWWRCLVVLRLRQTQIDSCARCIPSDSLSLT